MILRRSFLTRFGAAMSAGVAGVSLVRPQPAAAATNFDPARHSQDDWFDQIPGKHRLVFDTTSPEGFGSALLFARNYLDANKNEYGLEDSDSAIVIVARHRATAFGYNDATWAKYGKTITQRTNFNDPKTKEAPNFNLFLASGYGQQLTNNGSTADALAKRGVHFGVCKMATRGMSQLLATATGGNADKINEELLAGLVNNGRGVPAGIVAVNRAQERGYSFAYGV